MMREFHRNAAVDSKLYRILAVTTAPSHQLEREFFRTLIGANANTEALKLTLSRIKFGEPTKQMHKIDDSRIKLELVRYYNRDSPQVTINTREQIPGFDTTTLIPYADIYSYALLDGRRITPTSHSRRNSVGSSIIQAMFGNDVCAGEIRAMLLHRQPGVPSSEDTLLLMVTAWIEESEWHPLDKDTTTGNPELGISTWEYGTYQDPNQEGSRPLIIPLADVQCQVSRGFIDFTDPKLWITTIMDRLKRAGRFKSRVVSTSPISHSSPAHKRHISLMLLASYHYPSPPNSSSSPASGPAQIPAAFSFGSVTQYINTFLQDAASSLKTMEVIKRLQLGIKIVKILQDLKMSRRLPNTRYFNQLPVASGSVAFSVSGALLIGSISPHLRYPAVIFRTGMNCDDRLPITKNCTTPEKSTTSDYVFIFTFQKDSHVVQK
ncbi:hypothetical protein C8R44DRAFT_741852 [Mycena epipterygia]|nr:hypothetical protein C8R44DRAFT_741852 [Mycena epipterygia]